MCYASEWFLGEKVRGYKFFCVLRKLYQMNSQGELVKGTIRKYVPGARPMMKYWRVCRFPMKDRRERPLQGGSITVILPALAHKRYTGTLIAPFVYLPVMRARRWYLPMYPGSGSRGETRWIATEASGWIRQRLSHS